MSLRLGHLPPWPSSSLASHPRTPRGCPSQQPACTCTNTGTRHTLTPTYVCCMHHPAVLQCTNSHGRMQRPSSAYACSASCVGHPSICRHQAEACTRGTQAQAHIYRHTHAHAPAPKHTVHTQTHTRACTPIHTHARTCSTHSASCRDLSASSRMWVDAPRSTMVHASPCSTPAGAGAGAGARSGPGSGVRTCGPHAIMVQGRPGHAGEVREGQGMQVR